MHVLMIRSDALLRIFELPSVFTIASPSWVHDAQIGNRRNAFAEKSTLFSRKQGEERVGPLADHSETILPGAFLARVRALNVHFSLIKGSGKEKPSRETKKKGGKNFYAVMVHPIASHALQITIHCRRYVSHLSQSTG